MGWISKGINDFLKAEQQKQQAKKAEAERLANIAKSEQDYLSRVNVFLEPHVNTTRVTLNSDSSLSLFCEYLGIRYTEINTSRLFNTHSGLRLTPTNTITRKETEEIQRNDDIGYRWDTSESTLLYGAVWRIAFNKLPLEEPDLPSTVYGLTTLILSVTKNPKPITFYYVGLIENKYLQRHGNIPISTFSVESPQPVERLPLILQEWTKKVISLYPILVTGK